MIDYERARENYKKAYREQLEGDSQSGLDYLITAVCALIPDEAPVVAEDPWNFHSEQGIDPWPPFVVPVELIPDRVARAEKRMAELEEALRIAEKANIDAGARIDDLMAQVEFWEEAVNVYNDKNEVLQTKVADLTNKLGEALLPNELVRGPDGRYWEVLARGQWLATNVVLLRSGDCLDSVLASTFDINYTPIYKTPETLCVEALGLS